MHWVTYGILRLTTASDDYAGTGFEPVVFRSWAWRVDQFLYPASSPSPRYRRFIWTSKLTPRIKQTEEMSPGTMNILANTQAHSNFSILVVIIRFRQKTDSYYSSFSSWILLDPLLHNIFGRSISRSFSYAIWWFKYKSDYLFSTRSSSLVSLLVVLRISLFLLSILFFILNKGGSIRETRGR